MKHFPAIFYVVLLTLAVAAQDTSTSSASTPVIQRDTPASQALSSTFTQLGASPPRDSVATGSVALTVGTRSEKGTVTIRTRGLKQTSETLTTDHNSPSNGRTHPKPSFRPVNALRGKWEIGS